MPWKNDRAARDRSNATYGADWRKARLKCLQRCQWRCEIRLAGCQGAASQVDHITPVSQGGTHDQSNLRGACKSCHAKVTAQQGGGFRSGRRTAADPKPTPRTDWSRDPPSTSRIIWE